MTQIHWFTEGRPINKGNLPGFIEYRARGKPNATKNKLFLEIEQHQGRWVPFGGCRLVGKSGGGGGVKGTS